MVALSKKIPCLHNFKNLYGTHAFTRMTFVFSEFLKVFFFMKFDLLKDCTLSSSGLQYALVWVRHKNRQYRQHILIFMVTASPTALQTKRKHTVLEVHYNRHSQIIWKLLLCSLVYLSIHHSEYHLRFWQESKINDTSVLRYWHDTKVSSLWISPKIIFSGWRTYFLYYSKS